MVSDYLVISLFQFFFYIAFIRRITDSITQNMGKERENSYGKLKTSPEKGTHKHTEIYSKYFDDHKYLSQSEESKCMIA